MNLLEALVISAFTVSINSILIYLEYHISSIGDVYQRAQFASENLKIVILG